MVTGHHINFEGGHAILPDVENDTRGIHMRYNGIDLNIKLKRNNLRFVFEPIFYIKFVQQVLR